MNKFKAFFIGFFGCALVTLAINGFIHSPKWGFETKPTKKDITHIIFYEDTVIINGGSIDLSKTYKSHGKRDTTNGIFTINISPKWWDHYDVDTVITNGDTLFYGYH